jgi:hypothetical protein
MNLETIQLSPTAMGYINWNDGNAIASVCLDVYATPDDIEPMAEYRERVAKQGDASDMYWALADMCVVHCPDDKQAFATAQNEAIECGCFNEYL